MKLISVIVPTMNRKDDLLEFVSSLLKQSRMADELVIVDAGDTPSLKSEIEQKLENSNIVLKYATSVPGTSIQRNVAMELAAGDFYFFFDDDIVLEPDYIEKSMLCFELPHSPPVGGVLGTFNSPYSMPNWRRRYAKIFQMTHLSSGDKAKLMPSGAVCWLIEPSQVVEVPVCSGGRVAFRKECFETEKWDDFLPGYTMSEDVEISYRISKKWTLVQTPDAKLFHKSSPVNRHKVGERIARVIYSRFYFFNKHMPKKPRQLAAFTLWNLGNTALYFNRAIFNEESTSDIFRGIAKGYRLCARDLLSRG